MLNGFSSLVAGEFYTPLLELPCEKEYPFNISRVVCPFDTLAAYDKALIPFFSLFLVIII